jgi:hypothetical protein
MLPQDDMWLLEDNAFDDSPDLLTIPQIREHVVRDSKERDEDDLGLRSLFEWADMPGIVALDAVRPRRSTRPTRKRSHTSHRLADAA